MLARGSLIAALLAWYDRHRRALPWRARPGETADPYRVWLSEIMLQQTTVGAVIPYFARFLTRFPTVEALAAADESAVMQAWAGLGYYARARNLHRCARLVAQAGGFPREPAGLRALPGIGPYTATAIAAIAFDRPGIPIDGNVERVLSRLDAVITPLPQAKPAIGAIAAELARQPAAEARASDTAQALFDLGATICTPAAPGCALCPWLGVCAGQRQGIAASLPRKQPKPVRPVRHGAVFYLADDQGRLLLRRRPPHGLLGGMNELPGTAWRAAAWDAAEAMAAAPAAAAWAQAGAVRHVFTHFELRLTVFAAQGDHTTGMTLAVDAALPSVMRKCIAVAESFLRGR